MAAVAEIVPEQFAPHSRPDPSVAGNPEFDLLLACCRAELSGRSIRPHISPLSNWSQLLKIAEHHRVLPAVYSALRQINEVPPAARSEIQARFRSHMQRTLRLSTELITILHEFERVHIPVMPHKGPVMARLLFSDAVMRQSGDLDLLVRPADVPRASAVLQQLGYQSNLTLSPRKQREHLRISNEFVFGCERGKNLIELQWQVLPRFYSVAFQMESLFSRSLEIEFEGRRVRVLGKEDQMLILCVHAAKHHWEHLGMVRDIARLASFDLDWEWIRREAKRLGIAMILNVSLLLVEKLLGLEVPIPASFDEYETLANHFEARLRTSSYCVSESFTYFRQMLALRERWADRLLFALRLALTPSVGEWQSVNIPDRLFPLYRGVRMIRLLRRLRAA